MLAGLTNDGMPDVLRRGPTGRWRSVHAQTIQPMCGHPRVPSIVALEISIRLYRTGRRGSFAGTWATNDQGLATKRDAYLWGAVRHRVGNDLGAKHLHVPVSRVLRPLADDVGV